MDGNGRWAKKRMLPRFAGHKAGVEAVRRTARAARDMGLEALTLYAFSSENWKRPESEISDLMGLLRHFIQADLAEFEANNVRLRVIGDYGLLDPSLVAMIDDAVERTANNGPTTVAVALNYGSQDELVRVARSLARKNWRNAALRSAARRYSSGRGVSRFITALRECSPIRADWQHRSPRCPGASGGRRAGWW